MAGSGTAPRRWIVPSVLLAVLLAKSGYGVRDVIVTMQGEAGRGGLWRCPCRTCGRVEWWLQGRSPRCEGTPKHRHDKVTAIRETKPGAQKTDEDHYFF
jgi:hypothetical protein